MRAHDLCYGGNEEIRMGKRFSVVTLTYRSFNHLKETILSVCAQDYDEIEYIICDDGSENFPQEQIREWIENNKGPNLKHYKIIQQMINVGTVRNINYAYSQATGDYFLNLSSGDVFFETHTISKIAEQIASRDAQMLVTSRILYIDSFKPIALVPHYGERERISNLKKREDQYSAFLSSHIYGMASGSVLCVSRDMMEEMGYFDEQYTLWEDGPFLEKYLKKYKLDCCPELISIWYEQGGISTGGIKELSSSLRKDTMLFNQNVGVEQHNCSTIRDRWKEQFVKTRSEASSKRKKLSCYLRYPLQATAFLESKLQDRMRRLQDRPVISKALEARTNAAVKGC